MTGDFYDAKVFLKPKLSFHFELCRELVQPMSSLPPWGVFVLISHPGDIATSKKKFLQRERNANQVIIIGRFPLLYCSSDNSK